jgi:hypothetical protein
VNQIRWTCFHNVEPDNLGDASLRAAVVNSLTVLLSLARIKPPVLREGLIDTPQPTTCRRQLITSEHEEVKF